MREVNREEPGMLRSVRLFRLSLAEQSDPDSFYTALATWNPLLILRRTQ
jgi:hypothetical protein